MSDLPLSALLRLAAPGPIGEGLGRLNFQLPFPDQQLQYGPPQDYSSGWMTPPQTAQSNYPDLSMLTGPTPAATGDYSSNWMMPGSQAPTQSGYVPEPGPSAPTPQKVDPLASILQAIQEARARRDAVQQHAYDLQPPARKGVGFGTKDLVPLIAAAIAAMSGKNGQEFAGGLAGGYFQGKNSEAEQDDAYRQAIYQWEQKQRQNKLDLANQSVSDLGTDYQNAAMQQYRQDSLMSKEDIAKLNEDGRNTRATATNQIRHNGQLMSVYKATIMQARDMLSSTDPHQRQIGAAIIGKAFEDSQHLVDEGFDLGDLSRQVGAVDFSSPTPDEANKEASTKDKQAATKLKDQKFDFNRQYDPKVLERVNGQIQALKDKHDLAPLMKERIQEVVDNFPAEHRAKLANMYLNIASKEQKVENGGGTADDVTKEVSKLYSFYKNRKGFLMKRQSDFLAPMTDAEKAELSAVDQQLQVITPRMEALLKGNLAKKEAKAAGRASSSAPNSEIAKPVNPMAGGAKINWDGSAAATGFDPAAALGLGRPKKVVYQGGGVSITKH